MGTITMTTIISTKQQRTKEIVYWIAIAGALVILISSFYALRYTVSSSEKIQKTTPAANDPSIELIAITEPDCWACSVNEVLNVTLDFFPTAQVTVLNTTDTRAQELLDKYQVQILPAYFFNKSLELSAAFQNMRNSFEWKGDYYVLKPTESRAVYYRRTTPIENHPKKGNKEKIIMRVFADFQCPHTKNVLPELREVYEKYRENITWVHHNFPLRPQSKDAALAAACAQEQNKFWEYFDILFDNQNNLQIEGLKGYAQDLNLKMQQFNTCLETRKYNDQLKKEYDEARALGLTSTPVVFINNIIIRGEHPFKDYQYVIEQELKRAS